MKAEVPYLARVARQRGGQAMLWPPRQLFSGDIDTPVRLPDRTRSPRRRAVNVATPSLPGSLAPAGPGEERSAETIASAHGVDTGDERRADLEAGTVASVEPVPAPSAIAAPVASVEPVPAPSATATPVTSTWQEPAAGSPVTPGSRDIDWPPQATSHRPVVSYSGQPGSAAAGPANTVSAHPVAPPTRPLAAGSWPARPPGSWASPLGGGPVDLPEAIELVPLADEAAWGAGPVLPTTPPSRSEAAATAGSRQDQRTDDAGASVARGAAGIPRALGPEGAADPDRPREPGAVRELMPPLSSSPRPVAMPGTEPGEPYREPRVHGRPQVLIGTIEVTVVPPAPPSPAAGEIRPHAPVTRGWFRPPSLLASSVGGERLRDGCRRWYGTAQG